MVFDTENIDENKRWKALLQLWGREEIMSLFEHEGKVTLTDTFEQAIDKIRDAIQGQINEVYPVFKLFCEMPKGKTPFRDWYTKVFEQAKLCNFADYSPQKAACNAMPIQTSNHKLRKQALAEGIDFNNFVNYGLALEASSS